MTAFLWWRSWHGAPMDEKWPVIAARSGVKAGIVSAVAWALYDYASQHKNRGTIEGFDTEVYAVFSGFPETEIAAVIKAMTDKGIITNGRLTNWEKRQPKREDYSNERVRKWREVKRSVTQCNAAAADETIYSSSASSSLINIKESLFSLYENEIGILSPMIADELKLAETEYPSEWFPDAFKEAADHNARSWKYIKTILTRWKVEGKNSNNSNGNKQKRYGLDARGNQVEIG
jgi:DnaD/phage-associated family protein